MAAEVLLNLFDSYWFLHEILSKRSPSLEPQESTNPSLQVDQLDSVQEETLELPNGLSPPCFPTLRARSLSDHFLNTKSSLFSDSSCFVSTTPNLQTIFSGKQSSDGSVKHKEVSSASLHPTSSLPSRRLDYHLHRQEERPAHTKKVHGERTRSTRRVRPSKSMSELEFDELKGFMDLGFVFTEEDKGSELGSIIPGLQRLVSIGEQERDEIEEDHDQRMNNKIDGSWPYLSEAWDVLEQRKKENQLMNWRIPANLGKDMKHHLRFWAHTVASSVS